MASLQARITALAQAIGADIKALVNVYMPRAAFGGTVDKTRKMANAQVGAVDVFVTLDGAGTDWPAQSLSTAWWNVFTFGIPGRLSQVAQQVFHTRVAQFWFRHLHDAIWTPWYRHPFTFAETGFILQDGGALGYGSGCGGSVTQAVSKSTAVTLNKPCGQITLHNASMAAGATVQFNFSNSYIGAYDKVLCQVFVGGVVNAFSYRAECSWVGPGGGAISVTNVSNGALAEALTLNFAVIKGSIT